MEVKNNNKKTTELLVLTDLSLDIVHILMGTESRLAHNALWLGSGRWLKEGVLAGTRGVNCQDVATGLRFIYPCNIVTRALLTHKLFKKNKKTFRLSFSLEMGFFIALKTVASISTFIIVFLTFN